MMILKLIMPTTAHFSSFDFDSFLFFGPRASTYRLVLRVFVFKEIWLKLNYVKIFRQHFCILYILQCAHILKVTRQYHLDTLPTLCSHWNCFFPNDFYVFILHLISFNWRQKNTIETHAQQQHWCIGARVCVSKIYLHTKIEWEPKTKQIDWHKSMHVCVLGWQSVWCDGLLLCCSCDRHFVCAHVFTDVCVCAWVCQCGCVAAHFMQIGQFESKFTLYTIKHNILNMQIPTDVQVATKFTDTAKITVNGVQKYIHTRVSTFIVCMCSTNFNSSNEMFV